MRILVAEDEKDLNALISKKLTSEGYSIDSCYDGEEAIDILRYTKYDMVVLDIMMPKVNGNEVLRFLRESNNMTPVLFLTAKDSIEDRVKGLDSGANDYLIKPFSFDELLARIRVILRNSFGNMDSVITVGDLSLDMSSKIVTRDNKEIILSAKEYALLEYLMLNKGKILSKENIENHVWNFDYVGGSNIVDVYINYLRKKIDSNSKNKLIHTQKGRGYIIKEDVK